MAKHDKLITDLLSLARQQGRTLEASYTGIVGLVIAVLRNGHGWSQNQLSKQSGVSQPTLSRIELGEADITIPQMDAIASSLGVSSGFILDVADDFRHRLRTENITVATKTDKSRKDDRDNHSALKGAAAVVATGALLGTGPIGLLIGAAVGAIITARETSK